MKIVADNRKKLENAFKYLRIKMHQSEIELKNQLELDMQMVLTRINNKRNIGYVKDNDLPPAPKRIKNLKCIDILSMIANLF